MCNFSDKQISSPQRGRGRSPELLATWVRGIFVVSLLVGLQPHPGWATENQLTSKDEIISFEGSVKRGQGFEKELGNHLVLRIKPIAPHPGEGWTIVVMRKYLNKEEPRIMYFQFPHGGPPVDIAAGCGSMLSIECREYIVKGMGFWGRERKFEIGLGRILPLSEEEAKHERERPDPWNTFPKYEKTGTGTFTIEDVSIEKTADEEEVKRSLYWVDTMKFKVDIKLPVLNNVEK